jgi:hypothetical protein
MKNKIYKKLSFKKITISTYGIYGGTDDQKSSAFHEPTEQPIELSDDPRLISANNDTCI